MADGDDEDAFGDLEALLGGGDDGSEAASSGSEAEVEPEADDDDDLFGELASAFDAAPDEPEPEPELPAAVAQELPREPDRQALLQRCTRTQFQCKPLAAPALSGSGSGVGDASVDAAASAWSYCNKARE